MSLCQKHKACTVTKPAYRRPCIVIKTTAQLICQKKTWHPNDGRTATGLQHITYTVPVREKYNPNKTNKTKITGSNLAKDL